MGHGAGRDHPQTLTWRLQTWSCLAYFPTQENFERPSSNTLDPATANETLLLLNPLDMDPSSTEGAQDSGGGTTEPLPQRHHRPKRIPSDRFGEWVAELISFIVPEIGNLKHYVM